MTKRAQAFAAATDGALAQILTALHAADLQKAAKLNTIHSIAGDKRVDRRTWTMTDLAAIDTVRRGNYDEWNAPAARAALDAFDAAEEEIGTLTTALAALDAIYQREPWPRFWLVPGGHIHSSRTCDGGTVRPTTAINLLPELSGLTEADAVKERGAILCTHCYPSAPVEWTSGATTPEDPNSCPGKAYVEGTFNGRYGKCTACGHRVLVTTTGLVRKHKPPRA